ncbi:MAG: hypothetical protein KC493_10020 [Bacteriovoracaceae bacterium]|nr:hypothetical protein [Bacteriovoracaceae bacterium]
MSLINSLTEQSTFSFTGRINVLHSKTKQYFGSIHLIDGKITESSYKGQTGKDTLYTILIEDMTDSTPLKFVVEPELIEPGSFSYNVEEFKKDARTYYENFLATKKLKPPANLRLLVKGDFILAGPEVTGSEFQLLKIISDYSKVEDIYKESDQLEYQVTNSLVSLRKKGALRVYQP